MLKTYARDARLLLISNSTLFGGGYLDHAEETTKDMPIVQPPSFDALDLVPFQVSPHYLDPDPSSTHMGESQEERIGQFLEENATPVVGLREGTLLRVGPGKVLLEGIARARVFRRAEAPVEVEPGANLDELVFPRTEAP